VSDMEAKFRVTLDGSRNSRHRFGDAVLTCSAKVLESKKGDKGSYMITVTVPTIHTILFQTICHPQRMTVAF
jgi:hypothetical protein